MSFIHGTLLSEFDGVHSLILGIEPVYLVRGRIEALLHEPPRSPSG